MIRIDYKIADSLNKTQIQTFHDMWLNGIEDILNCTTLAGCGHPGGSMSSLNLLLTIYSMANITPNNIDAENRDRIVVSHGHISPGVYTTLAQYGFINREEMVLHYRKMKSMFSGHIESNVPGIEWNTGNLGQGISAAVGMALAGKTKYLNYKTIVCMGDGEQQKGQIAEARKTAVKFKLNNLLCVIDYNKYQIGGFISDVMPQNIAENYLSDGWNVIVIENGHDFKQTFLGLKKGLCMDVERPDNPTVVIAKTQMGKGISFMTDGYDFHGRACTIDEHDKAMKEINKPNRMNELKEKRKALPKNSLQAEKYKTPEIKINSGEPIIYGIEELTDNRSAYGKTLADLAKLNNFENNHNKICGVSCDLEGSVKMTAFKKTDPHHFFECGIQEHHAACMSGSLSKEGFVVFFSTFGTFGVEEVFNQQRLNAFNKTNVKTVCTHLGLSVGEDGPTHQCINYIGLLKNLPGQSIFIPADPNQTDHMIRYAASKYGNFFVGMGRAKTPVIRDSNDEPYFGKNYKFVPGKADILMEGNDGTIVAMGPMLVYALKAAKKIKETDNLNIRVINMGSIVPYDEETIVNAAKETKAIVTVEDHLVQSGIGSIIDQILIKNRISPAIHHLGVQGFVASGTPEELYEDQGMAVNDIVLKLKELIK